MNTYPSSFLDEKVIRYYVLKNSDESYELIEEINYNPFYFSVKTLYQTKDYKNVYVHLNNYLTKNKSLYEN